jgi:hypothetical protein
MLAVSLVFVGITLILNGILLWAGRDKSLVVTLNLFTGSIIIVFNACSILVGDQSELVGYLGGLLFGLTNLIIAVDNLTNADKIGSGIFSVLATIVALSLSIFYFLTGDTLKAVMWCIWSLIWAFSFIGFLINKDFLPATYVMYIVQGVLTTGIFGLLILFKIISF